MPFIDSRLPCISILIVLALFGCASSDVPSPPSACCLIEVEFNNGTSVFWQGLRIEDRILTVAHPLLVMEGISPRGTRVCGRTTDLTLVESGDLRKVRDVYDARTALLPNHYREDWALFKTNFTEPEEDEQNWFIGSGELAVGEMLTAFSHCSSSSLIRSVELRVANLDRMSEGILLAFEESGDLSEWSGSFVGRYDQSRASWELIGLLLAGRQERGERYVTVVARPEDRILSWIRAE